MDRTIGAAAACCIIECLFCVPAGSRCIGTVKYARAKLTGKGKMGRRARGWANGGFIKSA